MAKKDNQPVEKTKEDIERELDELRARHAIQDIETILVYVEQIPMLGNQVPTLRAQLRDMQFEFNETFYPEEHAKMLAAAEKQGIEGSTPPV